MTTAAQASPMTDTPTQPRGWAATLDLAFAPRADKTRLSALKHHGPLRVQKPFFPEGDVCHVYLLHPPGGVVGGDSLTISVDSTAGSHALLTTPGATKFYRSNGDTARQTQRLHVDAGATLEWLPQDNIVFPGAVVASDTRIELHTSARFIGWEVHCLGRPANHERFDQGQFRAQLQLLRDGQPLLWERLQVAAEPDLDALAGLRGHPVNATLVATGADASLLEAIQSNWSAIDSGGIGHTLLDDILVSRLLCHSTEQTHRVLTAIWAWLRPRLLGRKACHPRIWST